MPSMPDQDPTLHGGVRGNYNPPEDLDGEHAPPLRLRGGDGNENDGNIGDNLSLQLLKRLWPFLHCSG